MRFSRFESSYGGVWASNPAVQIVRRDRHASLSLAVLMLSESRHGTGERLDERAVSPLGRRPWSDDRDAGVLVSGTEHVEAHDGPARVRRRRESGLHVDAR